HKSATGRGGLEAFPLKRVFLLLLAQSLARRMKMSESNNGGGDKFLFFLAGAGIGAVLALLFAPKSGRETRDLIARTATDSRDFISNKVTEGRQVVEEKSRRIGDDFNSFLDKSKEAVQRQK